MECGLYLADIIWSHLIILPCGILFWSGTWKLLDIWGAPRDPWLVGSSCYVIGCLVHLSLFLLLPVLRNHVISLRTWRHYIISRLILYVDGIAFLLIWYGVWSLADHVLDNANIQHVTAVLVSTLLALFVIGGFSASTFAPLVVAMDTREDFYSTYPRMRTQPSSACLYLLDCMLTVFALTPLLTLLWWSLWSMADLKLFPNDHALSYVTCMSIGGGLSLIYLSVQRPLHRCLQILPDEFTESWRFRILVSTFKAVQAIASFLIWRALWSCMKDYVLLGQYTLELSVLWHFLGITLLVLTQTASSLSVPGGFAIDGEGGPAISMDCQISYFQEWLACKVEPSHVNSQEYGENNFDSESSPLITATS